MKPAVLIGLVALLVAAGAGGYLVGAAGAPDAADRARAMREAESIAAERAQRVSAADSQRRGERRGDARGRAAGTREGKKRGTQRAQRKAQQMTAQQQPASTTAPNTTPATPPPAEPVVCDGAIADDAHYAACLRQSGEPVPPGLGGTDSCPPGEAPASARGPCLPNE